MLIDKITLHNFRIYQGVNELNFTHKPEKNVTIISGNNGYGKTTLLTSLVWCMYGKLMVDVDERYRREIYESGGYKRFCQKIINRWSISPDNPDRTNLENLYKNSFGREADTIGVSLKELNSFSVSIIISDVFIPSVPCNKIEIVRTYNTVEEKEDLKILIDGRENELTKEVGSDIFINDFLLPKEIAKFFFFDAEKIVSLAEIRTIEEKRDLSRAYSEVLGIKKYEDLKMNLANIRLRLRKESASENERQKLEDISKQFKSSEKLLDFYRNQLVEIDQEITLKKQEADKWQEKLIREGSAISLDELADLKIIKESTANEVRNTKAKFKELLDLAPFAIASKKLLQVQQQIEMEEAHLNQKVSANFLNQKLQAIEQELDKRKSELALPEAAQQILKEIVASQLLIAEDQNFTPLLDMDADEGNAFKALKDNLFSTYSDRFKSLVKSLKVNQSAYAIIIKKLSDAESKEKDLVIQKIRKRKNEVDAELKRAEERRVDLLIKLDSTKHERNNLAKLHAETHKKVSIAEVDIQKDATAARLISELTTFISKLKQKKKEALQEKVLLELKRLMHKKDFISRVEVVIDGDVIDIEFYDTNNQIINKDGLSKGEQQLYATALLKALVDESNIKFPIFIDSPLQKFDQQHAQNILQEFYPNVSDQVVLFPLLEKELTETEYMWLLPRVARSYLIKNITKDQSTFNEVKPFELFNIIKSKPAYV